MEISLQLRNYAWETGTRWRMLFVHVMIDIAQPFTWWSHFPHFMYMPLIFSPLNIHTLAVLIVGFTRRVFYNIH